MAQPTPVKLDPLDLRATLEEDNEFFLQWALADQATYKIPDFHLEGFEIMCDTAVKRCVFAWPRGHAKTTLAKAACLKLFLHTDLRFIIYVSNTAPLAIAACNDIIALIDSDNVKAVYGAPEYISKQEGVGFYKFRWRGKVCILRALGVGQQVRGLNVDNQRPQCAICDDIEDTENLKSDYQFEQLQNWFMGAFIKALDRRFDKIIQIGNLIRAKSLLAEHIRSDLWVSRLYGAITADNQPLWPELWSLEELNRDYQTYLEMGKINLWFAEMMNITMNVSNAIIDVEKIRYRPSLLPSQPQHICITVDMAYSRQTWANMTAIVVHGYFDFAWQPLEFKAQVGMSLNDLAYYLVQFCKKWGCTVVGLESIAFEAVMKPALKYFFGKERMDHVAFVPLSATNQKAQRLSAWAGMIERGDYFLLQNEYMMTKQLLEFDATATNNEDDLIDAAAHIVQMLNRYSLLIFKNERPQYEEASPRGLSNARQQEKALSHGNNRQSGSGQLDYDRSERYPTNYATEPEQSRKTIRVYNSPVEYFEDVPG